MADALASALISTILTNINTQALRELGFLAGLQTELDNLSRSFTTIQAVLYDAELKQWNSGSEAVKNWLRQLKDAAYDADDVLDEFDLKVQRRQQQKGLKNHVRAYFSLHHNPIAFRVEMARKLKRAREKLDAIYQTRPPGLDGGSISSLQGVLEWRLTTSDPVVHYSEICGRDDQKAELINDLVSSSEALSVHALCGIGGLGKTTLAQLVLNDAETIKTHFDLRMWVCVSNDTNIKRLTRAIIESIGGDTGSNEQELDSLQRRLREKLAGKRFLLVLDDVWEDFPDKWDILKNAIRSGATGSVVLITTCIPQVVEKMATVPIRHMGRLSDDDSWSLFALHAFRTGKAEEFMKTFRERIVKKCGGVPLVLKVLGSLMKGKKQEKEWSDVMESELWDLPDEGEKILATLRLSYTHLPMNLRQCFSYCCIYPKDHEMEKDELIQIWMANGFISCGGRKDLHERGQEIFSELVARSFFQNVEMDYSGYTTCKMHDLLHDVATSVMEHELHLIQPGGSLDGAKNCRHVSYSAAEVEEYSALLKGNSKIPSLRSFIFMRKDGCSMNYGKDMKWLSSQKYLRILRLDCLNVEELSMSLSEHLRYLDVSRSNIKRLPESTSSLHKLQTLNLRFCTRLEQLPKGMKEMKSLVYLDINGCYSLKGMPPGMGQLKGMRKLSKFIVSKELDGSGIRELKELNGLEGELSISGLGNVKSVADFKSDNLMEKKMLTSLELIAETRFEENSRIDVETLSVLQPHQNLRKLLIDGYGSLELPRWMMDLHVHLPNLVEIMLTMFSQCQRFSIPLGRLDSLKVLELSGMSCLEHIGVEVYGDGERAAFPSLEKLTLYRMRSLKEWAEITMSASSSRAALPFPCLRQLSIQKCPLLTKFPIIPSVQDLSIGESTATTSHLANFIGLKSLSLKRCHQLESLPELGPQHNVCSLEIFRIFGCNILQSLPSTGLWCSSWLRILWIWNCSEFITLSDDGLRHLTALQVLYLFDCPKMTSLPESIQHLTALQTFIIESCYGLSCLTDGIRSLTTLVELNIDDCPDLGRRCEKDKGEDWSKIAHIPTIVINGKQMQGTRVRYSCFDQW